MCVVCAGGVADCEKGEVSEWGDNLVIFHLFVCTNLMISNCK